MANTQCFARVPWENIALSVIVIGFITEQCGSLDVCCSVAEKKLGFGFSTPLDKLVLKLKNATTPATLSDVRAQMLLMLAIFCAN